MKIEMFFPNQDRHVRFLLGMHISKRRHELGISLEDFSSRLNLTTPALRRIEAGRTKIDDTLFEKIGLFLNLEYDDLIEIRKIADIRYVNDLSKNLLANYPA